MTRYVAFLRALNVGGHVVKMDRLKKLFEALGLANVRTFIASGNVLFDSAAKDPGALEKKISRHLEKELGYEVATFIRSAAELQRIAACAPFPDTAITPGARVYVGFFADEFGPAARKTALAFGTDDDDFHADQRELFWLCRIALLDSAVSSNKLEKTLGRATFRNVNTIRRIAAIFAES
ncbi:MAG TPA: DUF1697 domain-containing protein [Gemmatimonadales bacterium]|nr:DUF1697 domain-containing protein [Gemmatimonadales bacterium]